MHAGKMDRTIKILSITQVTDEKLGSTTEEKETFWKCPANVRPLTGYERYTAAQEQAERDTLFTIRFKDGITPSMRILYEGVEYDLSPGREIGRKQWLEIPGKARKL